VKKEEQTPYTCHIFVCTNDRRGKRASCADNRSTTTYATLKQKIRENGLNGRVRVSQSGCLGQCNSGPNVMLYPQKLWFSHVAPEDVGEIVDIVNKIVKKIV